MRCLSTTLVVLLCLVSASTPASASTVRFLSDAELIARSDRVVHGRVIDQRTTRAGPQGQTLYTVTTIAVIEDLTGVEGDTVDVWELGGSDATGSMEVDGAAQFQPGEEVVVCLRSGPAGLRTIGMGLSKFGLRRDAAGDRQMIRSLGDTLVIGGTVVARSLDQFRRLASQVTGRAARAGLTADAVEAPAPAPEPFQYRGARWLQADSGVAIPYYVNASAASPLSPASPTSAVQAALAAWTNPAAATVILQYAGTTFQSASNGPWNGIPAKSVVISFEDPDNEIDDPVLALTFSFIATGAGGTVGGTRFDGYNRAAIKFQNAADLPLSYRQSLNFTRVLAHEVGHSIGLGHTQDDGSVASPSSNLMYPSCCYAATPTPPALGPDDLSGLVFLYPAAPACTFVVTPSSASFPSAGGSGSVTLTTYAGCAWTAGSQSSFVTVSPNSGSGTAGIFFNVAANGGTQRFATIMVGGQTVTIAQSPNLPVMTLDKPSLWFKAVTGGGGFTAQTSPQSVRVTQGGPAGTVTWTTTPTQPWLRVTPALGAGSANLLVSVIPAAGLPASGTVTGTIVVSYNGASTSTGVITVTLSVTQNGTSALPFGVVDTPLENTTGVTGAVPFTGWALDDVEVAGVSLCRTAVAGEAAGPDGRCAGAAQIFVADAVFIEGARPDVQAAYPGYPRGSRAGWGVMVLTNMLPNQGTGTYVFWIYARDREGQAGLLGTRTMTGDNAHATLPFGTIDTPVQGETISGNAYVNFGWALTQSPKAIPTDGSTLSVYVDGVVVGHPSYDHYRSDIATAFPGLANSDGAVGFWMLDTTTLGNGLHTIVWTATDSAGFTEGLGSRYFTVSNGAAATAAVTQAVEPAAAASVAAPPAEVSSIEALKVDATAIAGRRGWAADAPWRAYASRESAGAVVRGEELDRIELQLGEAGTGRFAGYLRVGRELTALPIGSRLDAKTGIFTWSPGVGFVGTYDLVFVRGAAGHAGSRQQVRIILSPKQAGRVAR